LHVIIFILHLFLIMYRLYMLIVLFFFNAGDATQEVRPVSLRQPGGAGGVGSASGADAEAEEP